VTRHFFVRTFRIALHNLSKLQLDAMQLYSCRFSIIVAPTGESVVLDVLPVVLLIAFINLL
jgi:hypothetical protein